MTLARTPSFAVNREDTGRVADAIIAKGAFVRVIAILLAALHAVLAITAVMEKSLTFDEPTHLIAGYSYWLKNDYRLDPENGVRARANCTPSEEQKACWLSLVRFS